MILYVRVVDGRIKKGESIRMMATGANGLALEVGHLNPAMQPDPSLKLAKLAIL